MTNDKPKIKRGFSLIEILIIISLVSIMVGISWTALRFLQPSWRLSSLVRDLVTDLRFTQQLAVTEQLNYGVYFSTSTREYQIIKYGTTSQIILTKTLPEGIEFQEITGFIENEAIFNPYGAVKAEGSVSLINEKAEIKTVEVRPSGFVRIVK